MKSVFKSAQDKRKFKKVILFMIKNSSSDATSSQKSQKNHLEQQREKFYEKLPKSAFIDIHLFRKGAGETEKQRENS